MNKNRYNADSLVIICIENVINIRRLCDEKRNNWTVGIKYKPSKNVIVPLPW